MALKELKRIEVKSRLPEMHDADASNDTTPACLHGVHICIVYPCSLAAYNHCQLIQSEYLIHTPVSCWLYSHVYT